MNVMSHTSFFSVVDDSDSFSFSSSFFSSFTSDVFSELVSFCSDDAESDCSVLTTTELTSVALSFSEDLSSSGFSF